MNVSRSIVALTTVSIFLVLAAAYWRLDVPGLSDEVAYIAMARYIADGTIYNMSFNPPYRFGGALLISPFYYAFGDSYTSYNFSILLSCLFIALLPFSLLLLAKQFGFRVGYKEFIAIAIVALLPNFFYHGSAAWAEAAFRFFFVIYILFAARFHNTGNPVNAVMCIVSGAVLYSLHQRAAFLVPLSLVLILYVCMAKAMRWYVYFGLLVLAVLSIWSVVSVHEHFIDVFWPGRADDAGTASQMLRRIFSEDGPRKLIGVSFGHLWSQLASTYGLWGAGVICALVQIFSRDRMGAIYMLILASTASIFAASAAQMILLHRIDHAVFARYNDGASPVLVALGLLFILRESQRRVRNAVSLSAGAAILSALAVGVLLAPEDFRRFTPSAMPAAMWIGLFADIQANLNPVLIAGTLLMTTLSGAFIAFGRGALVILAGVVLVVNSVVYTSAIAEHATRKDAMASRVDHYDKVPGTIYWDVSARFKFDLTFDQMLAVRQRMPTSNLSENDIPEGAGAVTLVGFSKDGYSCVSVIPGGVQLMLRGPGKPQC